MVEEELEGEAGLVRVDGEVHVLAGVLDDITLLDWVETQLAHA